jgi:hypothetical protein
MTFGDATPNANGSPPVTRIAYFHRAVSTTPASRKGAHVDAFPFHAAFPDNPAGRRSHLDFRGLLGLHSHYGPMFRSTAQRGLCHEAPTRPVTRPSRSSATRSIDISLGGIFLPWRYAPTRHARITVTRPSLPFCPRRPRHRPWACVPPVAERAAVDRLPSSDERSITPRTRTRITVTRPSLPFCVAAPWSPLDLHRRSQLAASPNPARQSRREDILRGRFSSL